MTLYLRGTWTCPSSNPGTTDKQWDLATLTKIQFMKKYNMTEMDYEFSVNGLLENSSVGKDD